MRAPPTAHYLPHTADEKEACHAGSSLQHAKDTLTIIYLNHALPISWHLTYTSWVHL